MMAVMSLAMPVVVAPTAVAMPVTVGAANSATVAVAISAAMDLDHVAGWACLADEGGLSDGRCGTGLNRHCVGAGCRESTCSTNGGNDCER